MHWLLSCWQEAAGGTWYAGQWDLLCLAVCKEGTWDDSHLRSVSHSAGFPLRLQLPASCFLEALLSLPLGLTLLTGAPAPLQGGFIFYRGPLLPTRWVETTFLMLPCLKDVNSFPEESFINYNVHSFKTYNVIIFGTFTELFDHHHNLILEHIRQPKSEPRTYQQSLPRSPSVPAASPRQPPIYFLSLQIGLF